MILLTGFPGFLGSFLISSLLDLIPKETQIVCLVQDKFLALAKEKISSHPEWTDRVLVVIGDITKANLGLTKEWNDRVENIYHLAAVYDLSVSKDLAHTINVEGTKNVLQFAKACKQLKRLDYVSTCYVSGRIPGHFFETDLAKEQTFNNFYEETKFHAEEEVEKARRDGLPVTIYRPSIVVGDSASGWTQKFDGPYYIMQWVDRQKFAAVLPALGDYERIQVNLVPVDFVSNAIARLSQQTFSIGKTYQLADPNPPTIKEFLGLLEGVMHKKILTVPFPAYLTKLSLKHIAPLRNWMKINPDTIDYFTHPTVYDTTNATEDLGRLDVKCPKLKSYLPKLVSHMQSVKERSTEAMI
ncbi:MAG: SDR family oxidoreductase [Bdellovibrionales bacterium]|nr:SDR family oxidoreductase [Bdellovibrionales bacterium]